MPVDLAKVRAEALAAKAANEANPDPPADERPTREGVDPALVLELLAELEAARARREGPAPAHHPYCPMADGGYGCDCGISAAYCTCATCPVHT